MIRAPRPFVALVLAAAGIIVAAADAPYVGKWKFNAAKSQLAGSTFSIENAASGMMKFDFQGFSYLFKTDGKEYAAPDGSMNVWTAVNASTWESVSKLNGKVVVTYTMTVNGETCSLKVSQMKPDGTSLDSTIAYTRVSGGPGMTGKWRSTEVKAPALSVEITASGADGLSWKDDSGYAFTAKFDGKDYQPGGTMAGAKFTLSLKKLTDRSFELITKINGKAFATDTFTVSADGKTLTDTSVPANAKTETTKTVYDKY